MGEGMTRRFTEAALRRRRLRIVGGTSAPRVHIAGRPRAEPTPHDKLWEVVSAQVPGAHREYAGAVPGRRFRIDIALPECRLAIEVDGWQFHGRHKGDFQRDRERQNALTLAGWRILRFSARDVRHDLERVLAEIRRAADPTTGLSYSNRIQCAETREDCTCKQCN